MKMALVFFLIALIAFGAYLAIGISSQPEATKIKNFPCEALRSAGYDCEFQHPVEYYIEKVGNTSQP